MAEYTIPKPYRDFYVTNPYIELKESNERLQRIVKSGYVATDSFDGVNNQVITFDKEKHGFSLTNDNSRANAWSVNLLDSNKWESGTITSDEGIEFPNAKRIRTIDYYPVMTGATYTFNLTATTANYQVAAAYYDTNKRFLYFMAFTDVPATLTTGGTQPYYVRFILKTTDDAQIQPSIISTDITALSVSVSSYTAPSDVTVKVANVIEIDDSLWKQQVLASATGLASPSTRYVSTLFIPYTTGKNLTPYVNPLDKLYAGYVYEYDENQTYIKRTILNSGVTISLNSKTSYLKFMLFKNQASVDITVSEIIGDKPLIVTNEKMIVSENDTRIVTMPPFTSLYIQSNVPYHGHALDLSE